MSRYRGPRLRIIRRLGNLPGLTKKISKKSSPPGQQGTSSLKKKISQFNTRLREKQKLRYHYGVTERKLLNYVKKARKKKGSAGQILITILEMRLDNLIFRLGFSPSIFAAKQLINHGHILVNSYPVTIPSYICKPKTIIKVKNNYRSKELVKKNLELCKDLQTPQHLMLDKDNLEARVINLVNRKSISILINELLVIEYYSRKL